MTMNGMMDERIQLAQLYFRLGLSYIEILAILAQNHSIIISERTLHRILRSVHFYRRSQNSDIAEVINFVQNLLASSGSLHGYRWMHSLCLQHGLVVSREDVRIMMSVLDTDGVLCRTARRLRRREYFAAGPNFLWHFDGYDKLKLYGLCISGCIDGFSRNIIWLQVYKTNNDPKVIAGYYINVVQEKQGAPLKIRADCGTENGHIAAMQSALVGEGSFIYGRSTSNQRIESWWGILRRQCAQFWMDCLENLKDLGYFIGDFLDKSLVQFCFTPLVQEELDNVVTVWNSHRIRPSRNERVPAGRPIIMYSIPQLYHTRDYLEAVDDDAIDICRAECTFVGLCCDEEIYQLCQLYMNENGWIMPVDHHSAIELYMALQEAIKSDL